MKNGGFSHVFHGFFENPLPLPGADVSAVDEDGHTAHHLARRRGCAAVEALLRRFAAQAAGAWSKAAGPGKMGMSENGVYPQWNSHFWLG